MKQFPLFRRGLAAVLTLLLVCALPLSASAFFWDKEEVPAVADFTKNGLVGDTIAFSPQDFAVESGADAVLSHITLVSLPDPGAGSLTMGGQALTVGTVIDATALSGLAFQSSPEILLLYAGVHAILYYRLAHWLHRHGLKFLARFLSQWARFWTGIEIHPGAVIGRRLVIDHGTGIVIGETAELGDDCLLYQGVTLGGTGKDVGKRHPTLGSNVMVGAGAKVLGPITIHDNARIAAGAVVLQEVPEGATAVGVPAQIVRVNGEKVHRYADEVDQTSVENPTLKKIEALTRRVEELERRLAEQSAPGSQAS